MNVFFFKSDRMVDLKILLIAILLFHCAGAMDTDTFINPPNKYAPLVWWDWMNGHITEEAIVKDLHDMKQKGIGGVVLGNMSEGTVKEPVIYYSKEWFKLLDVAVLNAHELGIEFGIFNGAGWSATGAPWITPELAMQEVVWTEKKVAGPVLIDEFLEKPTPVRGLTEEMKKDPIVNKRYYVNPQGMESYYRDFMVIAFPTPSGEEKKTPLRLENWREKAGYSRSGKMITRDLRSVDSADCIQEREMIVLNSFLNKEGRLRWDVPAGNWTILRMGYQPTGRKNHPAPEEGSGLEIDKCSKRALQFHWQKGIKPLIDRYQKTPLSSILVDSFEAGQQNWTPGFENSFEELNRYPLAKKIVALTGRIVGSVSETEDFLFDFRKTINHLVIENYYQEYHRLCKEKGIKFLCEPYGNFGNMSDFDIMPHLDVPLGEFWALKSTPDNRGTIKLAASAARVYGKKVVGAEAFTGIPEEIFKDAPQLLKTQGDAMFIQGINQFHLHGYVHNPYSTKPGFGLGAYGSRFDRGNSWWEFGKEWIRYLTRCQMILQKGRPVAEILYYLGEQSPMSRLPSEELNPVPPEGYDYDFCPTDLFYQIKVLDQKIVLPSGNRYEVLVIPPSSVLSGKAKKKVRQLLAVGARIIWEKSGLNQSGGNAGEKLTNILSSYRKFQYQLKTPEKELTPSILSLAMKMGEEDCYFISNQDSKRKEFVGKFRTIDSYATIYYPMTGDIEELRSIERVSKAEVTARLVLDPEEAYFILFQKTPQTPSGFHKPKQELLSVDEFVLIQPWNIIYRTDQEVVAQERVNSLESWHLNHKPEIMYHSGIGDYSTEFDLDPQIIAKGKRFFLSFDQIGVIADVKLNGKSVGTIWARPFEIEITKAIVRGKNQLSVRVANLEINRIKGDLLLKEDLVWTEETGSTVKGKTLAAIPDFILNPHLKRKSGRKSFTGWQWPQMEKEELQNSGLSGAVKVLIRK
jgi:hypothetical protein